eukprot:TRINITY_DN4410_c1_g1_i2.p1 TRINITY_DN4410_c1_g1~~TRINITY_DN4410_c1_g1_i2.p1  ORF type:complete len:196 (-),score=12.77 TRINITY_DN4410_c1_g1_i2:150-737(-)
MSLTKMAANFNMKWGLCVLCCFSYKDLPSIGLTTPESSTVCVGKPHQLTCTHIKRISIPISRQECRKFVDTLFRENGLQSHSCCFHSKAAVRFGIGTADVPSQHLSNCQSKTRGASIVRESGNHKRHTNYPPLLEIHSNWTTTGNLHLVASCCLSTSPSLLLAPTAHDGSMRSNRLNQRIVESHLQLLFTLGASW